MRASPRFAVVALTAALQSAPALAQALPCLECRALIEFGDCDSAATPPKGSISVVGTVVRVERMQCGTVGLTVDVKRSSLSLLPERVKIDVGQCLVWRGKAGDNINAMVVETPSENGAYQARTCN
jgi:flavin reductase (DIM6/NTAB) family NADH-FMN oxidoreductase RutF